MNSETISSLSAEAALVRALNHLKEYEFDKEFLDSNTVVEDDHLPQTFFAFEIGGNKFAVSAQSYCEVLTEVTIAAIPNAPTQLVGLCNLRGVLVPVFQLHHSFDQSMPKRTILFCIGKGEKALGLLVDALPISTQLRPYELLHETAQEHPLIKKLSDSAYFAREGILHLLDGQQLGEKLLHLTGSSSKFSADVLAVDVSAVE